MLSNTWKKSSRSNGNGGNNCVEVRMTSDGILVRDTKDQGNGPVLTFTPDEWLAFLEGANKGEFDI